MGLTEEITRRKVAEELEGLADYAARQGNDPAENAMRGLQRFVEESGTLTVTATPRDPVPVLYFFMGRDLYENLRLLNIDVVTQPNQTY